MRHTLNRCAVFAALSAILMLSSNVRADVTIETFDNFVSDALFGNWAAAGPPTNVDPVIVSGPTSYSITAGGYGSNYKYIGGHGIVGAGHTTIELEVTLSGPPEADGQLGVLLQLIDGDGSHYHYRWYGQTLGTHTLTMDVQSPTIALNPGSPPLPVASTPGLDLNNLLHMHMELDPGAFQSNPGDAYTVEWQHLALTNFVPEPSSLVLLSSCGVFLGLRRRK